MIVHLNPCLYAVLLVCIIFKNLRLNWINDLCPPTESEIEVHHVLGLELLVFSIRLLVALVVFYFVLFFNHFVIFVLVVSVSHLWNYWLISCFQYLTISETKIHWYLSNIFIHYFIKFYSKFTKFWHLLYKC